MAEHKSKTDETQLVKCNPLYLSLCQHCVAYKRCDFTNVRRCTATYELDQLYKSVEKAHPVQRAVY